MGLLAGLDEAGRGAVAGPLAVAGLMIDDSSSDTQALKSLGVKDSKLLSRARRETIFPELVKNYKHSIKLISPITIDKYVGRKYMNINWLEAQTMAEIIDELAPSKAILDCPDINIPRFRRTVSDMLHVDSEIVAEYHADFNYLSVGAASILAKVTRDRAIDKLRERYGDFNSGYPSDPKCQVFFKNWLSEHGGERPSGWVRRSWSSWERWTQEAII